MRHRHKLRQLCSGIKTGAHARCWQECAVHSPLGYVRSGRTTPAVRVELAGGGLLRRREAAKISDVLLRSDGMGEFGEDRCELMPWVDIRTEFVVATTEVLDERVPGTDHPCRAQPFQAAHRP